MSASALSSEDCCKDCGRILTAEEAHYYADSFGKSRCEDCERAWDDRIDRWRAGGQDSEISAMFDEPRPPWDKMQ
jgi:hypothetical protein